MSITKETKLPNAKLLYYLMIYSYLCHQNILAATFYGNYKEKWF